MKAKITKTTKVPTISRKVSVTYKWDEVLAIREILTDYISILQHSYNQWLAAIASREYAINHPEAIKQNSKEMMENADKILEDIKQEMEQMKKDLPHIDTAISRAMQLNSKLDFIDWVINANTDNTQNNKDENTETSTDVDTLDTKKEENETNTEIWTWEVQDGTSTN